MGTFAGSDVAPSGLASRTPPRADADGRDAGGDENDCRRLRDNRDWWYTSECWRRGNYEQKEHLAEPVAPGLSAVHHQHFFNYRLDLDVDGATPNQVEEIETHALASGAGNPHGGGFAMQTRVLSTEHEARRRLDLHTGRRWRVVNPAVRGALGRPTGYELVPGANADPFAEETSSIRRRAGFLDAQFWATPYADSERYAAGNYPNQSPGSDGLARWTRTDRPLTTGDVVIWYTLGITHNPRPEDWPVMPVQEAGFRLVPVGFFDRNPVLGGR